MQTMDDQRLAVAEAIQRVKAEVRWKPGKGVLHLQKRKDMGHLPANASLSEYNSLIRAVVQDSQGRVFAYRLGMQVYVAIRSNVAGRPWLAIFSLVGILETAFPPDDIEAYLAQPGFTEIGTVEEMLA